MIPVRLRLRNFMSYGESVAPLDFAGIRLACLCGDNGHGKSALLDAITWALWGRARISERRDASEDELIQLGKAEMEVEFEFELDGARYAVLRKRAIRATARRRTSVGTLEFQVADGGAYRALTGDTMHATQRQINQVLRLDYDTFVNSAFILQGRADEFTRKTATERKRILSDLLGLGYYDELEERAREEVRGHEQARRDRQLAVEGIDAELEREPSYQREVQRLGKLVDDLNAESAEREREALRLRAALQALELKATHRAEIQARVERAEAQVRALQAQVVQAQARLDEALALTERAPIIREGYRELVGARAALADLDDRFRQLHELVTRQSVVKTAVAQARSELEGRQRVVAAEVARLRQEVSREPGLRKQEAELRGQLAGLDRLSEERDARLQEVESCRAQLELLTAANAKIKDDGTQLRERLDLLATAEATCPICGGALDAAGRERLRVRFEGERSRMANDYRDNQAKMKALEGQVEATQRRVQAIDESLRRKQALERSHATVEKALEDVAKGRSDLAQRDEELTALNGRLAAGEYARAEQAELARLDSEMATLAYDPNRHRQLRDRIAELAQHDGLFARLEVAEAEVPRIQADLAERARLAQDAAGAGEEDRARLAELDRELADKPEVERQLAVARAALDDAVRRHGAAREARGEAQQLLNHCQHLRGERVREVEALNLAAMEKSYYEDLAVAFGKKGIQAMIIESAIPEIEREANAVLARMTDGRLNVKFETQRDTRAGDGTIETLDIKISDELGVRSLELYSGGESFRVNFAIRIALSKLLTRRAGARVQTLVIDEGFGSQDTFGRQRLVEAINSVADDFAKIIVITHIDELKDAFPTRIDVVKGPDGSQITVN